MSVKHNKKGKNANNKRMNSSSLSGDTIGDYYTESAPSLFSTSFRPMSRRESVGEGDKTNQNFSNKTDWPNRSLLHRQTLYSTQIELLKN